MEYYTQKVDVLIDKDSDSWKRICERAERCDVPVEFVVNVLFATGTREFVKKQLDAWDEIDEKDK